MNYLSMDQVAPVLNTNETVGDIINDVIGRNDLHSHGTLITADRPKD